MKCVRCGTDNNLKERTEREGRCKNCNHPFVFDQKIRSQPSPFKGMKKNKLEYFKPLAKPRGTVNSYQLTDN